MAAGAVEVAADAGEVAAGAGEAEGLRAAFVSIWARMASQPIDEAHWNGGSDVLGMTYALAGVGMSRTCPTCRSVGSTPGLASSSCSVLMPSFAAILSSVSPDTTV